MKASQLYGMKIESEDKKIRGNILGISCVKDRIEGYICCNERQKEFFALSDCATCRNGVVKFKETGRQDKNGVNLRLGRAVYAKNGKFCGILDDCTVKDNVITFATVAKRKIPFNRIIVGDVFILEDENLSAELAAKDMFIDALCGR